MFLIQFAIFTVDTENICYEDGCCLRRRKGKNMLVTDFYEEKNCNTSIELIEALKTRSKTQSNEFELRTDSDYPYMTILIKNEYACVHFFDETNECGYYAYSENNDFKDDFIIFNIGSETSETEISKDLVISVEQAYEIAIEFLKSLKRSNTVKWFEL